MAATTWPVPFRLAHIPLDGGTISVIATGEQDADVNLLTLGAMAGRFHRRRHRAGGEACTEPGDLSVG